MSKSFVRKVSEKLISESKVGELKDCLVIIPSQRIGLHLKKEVSDMVSNATFLPEIITIDNFLTQQFDKVPVDNISVFFEYIFLTPRYFPSLSLLIVFSIGHLKS